MMSILPLLILCFFHQLLIKSMIENFHYSYQESLHISVVLVKSVKRFWKYENKKKKDTEDTCYFESSHGNLSHSDVVVIQ